MLIDEARRSRREEILGPNHHVGIEKLLEELKEQAHSDNPRELGACWSRFEHALQMHLADEEEHILPRFAEADPVEARAILADHAEIRRLLLELGVGIDLHLLRANVADQLLDRLRAHARREDAGMYPWALRVLGKIQ
jgi:hypothetical protein